MWKYAKIQNLNQILLRLLTYDAQERMRKMLSSQKLSDSHPPCHKKKLQNGKAFLHIDNTWNIYFKLLYGQASD